MENIKILVVDDDYKSRKLLHDFLSFIGYHVESATNGLDGLKLVENGCYKLIITDYEMPELNGVEFTKKVREKDKALPIIATSGSEVKALFLEAGADLFMQKPVDLKGLQEEIELII